MKNSIKFISQGSRSLNVLNCSYNAVAAIRNEEEVLCLVGSSNAYCPAGGRKVLKEIISTTEEGKCFYWKKIN